MRIRKLLYEDGFTIAGAREKLREEMHASRTPAQALVAASHHAVKKEVVITPGSGSSQATLPFLAPVNSSHTREELRRIQQQLRKVLDLLS
jgi:hypothetical protein